MIASNIYNPICINYFIDKEEEVCLIDCFSINKYQSINENILYISMNLYKLINAVFNNKFI